jgi:hypothetical protein
LEKTIPYKILGFEENKNEFFVREILNVFISSLLQESHA